MSKNILVTGNAGFFGSHLADHLIEKGHEVYGLDNLSCGFLENINPKCIFYEGDINNKELVKAIFRDRNPEIVYHFAADASESKSVFNPRFSAQNNLVGSLNLLEEFINFGAKRFVFVSSTARYGNQTPPFTEDMPAKPHDPYGLNKYLVEQNIQLQAEVHGFEWNIPIAHNIYGPRQNMTDPNRNAIAVFINRSLQNMPHIIYGDGTSKRSYTYIDDILDPLFKLGFDLNIKNQLVNIGPDEANVTVSVTELSEMINKYAGAGDIKPIYTPWRPRDIKMAYASANKARKLLGYQTKTSLEEGLKKTVEWARKVGPKAFIYETKFGIMKNLPEAWKKKV